MKDKLTPMMDPAAPDVVCPDCCDGHNVCGECGGLGYTVASDWRETRWPCEGESCGRGYNCPTGHVECRTCGGEGSFADPNAFLECPTCGEYLHEADGACIGGCGYVLRKAEVAA